MRLKTETRTEAITTRGGGRVALSVGGSITGRGADFIIIDDPLKAEDGASETARKRVIDWYHGTLNPAQRQGAGGHHPGDAAAAPGRPRRLRDRARRLA